MARTHKTFCRLAAVVSALLNGCVKAPAPLTDEEASTLFYANPSTIKRIGDPFILKDPDGRYYCYATSSNRGFMAWRSTDLVEWEALGVVFNALGNNQWASADFWAPEAVFRNGKYYMYYSGRWMKNSSLRIGVAESVSPEGPFADALGRPLFDFGYAVIDAHVFFDDNGKIYLYYVRDCSENLVNGAHESHIYGIELGEDMLSVKGEPVLLTWPEQPWETGGGSWKWNEAPFMLKHQGRYYLMYSANFYADKSYSVGYAVSDAPLGRFIKYEKNPVLASPPLWDHISGPGHNCVTVSPDGAELLAVYHTHTDPQKGGGDRQMAFDRLGFRDDGTLYINGPSQSKNPRPSGGAYGNIARTARIRASSSAAEVSRLVDGETGFYRKFSEYDWSAGAGDKSPRISFDWDEPVLVKSVLVYPGAGSGENPYSWSVSSNAGNLGKNLDFPGIPGGASVLSFKEKAVRSLTINLHSLRDQSYRISEIVILGKR